MWYIMQVLNYEKSNKKQLPDMKYTFCRQELQVAWSHPYLGIDNKLNWDSYRSNTIAKANIVLGCLRRNLDISQHAAKKSLILLKESEGKHF